MTIRQARPSASICLLRPAGDGAEVLMARRTASAPFMAGAWVFPGGVVDETDRSEVAAAAVEGCDDADDVPWRAAALRELVEETGVWLARKPRVFPVEERPVGAAVYRVASRSGARFDGGGLAWFSNWVTPTSVPVRFDARFYVASTGADVEPVADGVEMAEAAWVDPREAIVRSEAGGFLLALPTRFTLHHFAELGGPDDIVAHARALTEVKAVRPRVRFDDGGRAAVVLPGEPGYDDLPDLPPDPEKVGEPVAVAEFRSRPAPELDV